MKAILMSIQPKYCELIASGKKTIEVRKTVPKLKTPFKCYIYCTQDKHYELSIDCLHKVSRNTLNFGKGKAHNRIEPANEYGYYGLNGKVIGEFVCDEILPLVWDRECVYSPVVDDISLEKMSQLQLFEIEEYLKGKNGYGLHISQLKIYDKPKELSEFKRECNHECINTKKKVKCRKLIEIAIEGVMTCDNLLTVTRPPQSWMYVQELEG